VLLAVRRMDLLALIGRSWLTELQMPRLFAGRRGRCSVFNFSIPIVLDAPHVHLDSKGKRWLVRELLRNRGHTEVLHSL
jgi:hypothetical protein